MVIVDYVLLFGNSQMNGSVVKLKFVLLDYPGEVFSHWLETSCTFHLLRVNNA